jgi:lipoyl(octanoyl) transferase
MRPTPQLPPLEVYMLGLVDFSEVQQLQRRLVYELGEQGGAVLILCEHPPTISVGRSGSRAHIEPDDDALEALGIEVHWVNRGGGCVFHLPGQLAAYFAIPLDTFDLSLNNYLDRLHTAIFLVLEEFDLTGSFRPGLYGVFSGHARIATVGVAVTRSIAYHGLTLNVGPYLDLFDVLEEPGIGRAPLRHTSMEAQRQRHTAMPKVREALVRRLEEVFGLERHHVYTQHPMI